MSTNIVLIEDHKDFRESLSFLLNSNKQFICKAYGRAEDAMLNLVNDMPQVVIMDINLPGISGIDCTQRIKQKYPTIQILMCTVNEDEEKIFQALKAGASGYLLKRSAIDEIFASINDILTGGSPMTPVIARKVVASFFPKPIDTEACQLLSDRENEILDLLAKGDKIKEIADKTYLTISTVRTHIRNIYLKLQVNSRVEALNKARKNIYRN
ncbi:MAG: response regulator transcription factor [Chitinophagaceae bacterium]|nr:response regulator transcription factor [Chitinophagaceae bacterium]